MFCETKYLILHEVLLIKKVSIQTAKSPNNVLSGTIFLNAAVRED